jgi:hypothetical protein
MIPRYPEFKKLELLDQAEIDAHTARYPLYSDFEFANIWSWNVKEEMEVSILNGNLAIRFTDYTTGEPFLTFIGTNDANKTAQCLLRHDGMNGEAALHLVPEVAARTLDADTFCIEESRDHFDYVCDVGRHLAYRGGELKSHRQHLKRFEQSYPLAEYVTLDTRSKAVRCEIDQVYRQWHENKCSPDTSEAQAYERFFAAISVLPHSAVGIRVNRKLVAFHIVSLPLGTCANALFSKADVSYRGVFAALDRVVARDLLSRGYTHMNIQQDLGLGNLRGAKLSLHPAYFLKKYSVRLR